MSWDKAKPAAASTLRVSNPQLLANQDAIEAALDQDHDFTTGSTQTGKHDKVTFKAAIAAPTLGADPLVLYVKSGTDELHYKNASGEKKLTENATLNIVIGDCANIKIDEDNMASNSASHFPTQQSVKAYVDDNAVKLTGDQTVAGTKTFSGDPIITNGAPALILADTGGGFYRIISDNYKVLIQKSGSVDFASVETVATFETNTNHGMSPQTQSEDSDSAASVTWANGCILKCGSGTVNADTTVNISHGLTKCFKAFTQITSNTTDDRYALKVSAVGDSVFTVRNTNNATLTFDWFAIGR